MDLLVNTASKLPSIHSLNLELPKDVQSNNNQKIVLPSINNLNLPYVHQGLPASNFLQTSYTQQLPSINYQGFTNHQTTPPPANVSRLNSISSPVTSSYSNSAPNTPVHSQPSTTSSTPQFDGFKGQINGDELEASAAFKQEEDKSDSEPKKWKPRKKRQCPECKLFFSNLATHKSTHLNPTSRPHICEYCSRGFARPNDLFRHIKCHWKEIGSDKGQFKCPYKNHTSGDHCGHNSGIFSRCDTFKNHLKAIHFQYPNGIKKEQRAKSAGTCRMCQLSFNSVDDWLNNHLEKNQCPYANEYKKK